MVREAEEQVRHGGVRKPAGRAGAISASRACAASGSARPSRGLRLARSVVADRSGDRVSSLMPHPPWRDGAGIVNDRAARCPPRAQGRADPGWGILGYADPESGAARPPSDPVTLFQS